MFNELIWVKFITQQMVVTHIQHRQHNTHTNAIHMLNTSEGYAGGLNGRVYRTTDGGVTWNVLGSYRWNSPFNKLPTIF